VTSATSYFAPGAPSCQWRSTFCPSFSGTRKFATTKSYRGNYRTVQGPPVSVGNPRRALDSVERLIMTGTTEIAVNRSSRRFWRVFSRVLFSSKRIPPVGFRSRAVRGTRKAQGRATNRTRTVSIFLRLPFGIICSGSRQIAFVRPRFVMRTRNRIVVVVVGLNAPG